MHSDEMPEHFVRTGEALVGRREFLPNLRARSPRHRATVRLAQR
jgi:hypothetical protein